MKASFGFGEMPSVPEEEQKSKAPPPVRGLEDVAAEALARESEKPKSEDVVSPEPPPAPEAASAPEAPLTEEEKPKTYIFTFDERGKVRSENEARLEKEAAELKSELERTPEAEREKIGVGIHNFGFFVEETKNKWFAGIFNKFAETQMQEKSVTTRFIGKLGKQFEKDAAKAHERMVAVEKTKNRETLANAGYIAGNAVKLWTLTSGAVTMPLRAISMGGMVFARGADAAKEVRFENEKVIEKTRIEDMDKAAEEAWKVYEAAQNKKANELYDQWVRERMKGEKNRKATDDAWVRYELELRHTQSKHVTAERLQKAYHEQLPKDILARLEAKTPEQPGFMNRAMQGFMKVHIERSVKRLERKVAKIEGDEKLTAKERNAKRERLFNRFDRRLRDYDRAVGQLGTVDALAMGLRYAEMTGKVVTYAPAAYIALEKGFEMIGGLFERSEVMDALEDARDAATSGPAAVVDSGAALKLKSEILANLKEHAGMTGATETAPPDVLRQPYPTPGGTFGDSSLLGKETPLVELGPTTETAAVSPDTTAPKVETPVGKTTFIPEKPAGGTPFETAPADFTAVAQPSIEEVKMGEHPVPEILGKPPTAEISAEQMKLATVGEGEGVTHAIKRQLMQHAEQYGYTKESGDMDKWAVLKSKEIAMENGYIKPDGTEIRVLDQGLKGNPAYILEKDAAGKLKVAEYLEGKPTGGAGVKSPYEYEWKKPAYSAEVVERAKAAAEGIPEKIPAVREIAEMPMKLERVPVTELPPHKFPEWLTERLEYAKLAETLHEKTANLEHVSDHFDTYSLHVQEGAIKELAAFEKQLDYLEKHVDTLGLTPSQEDFIEMSKEAIEDMKEAYEESQEAFRDQLADLGVTNSAYEKAIASKGITVKEIFEMEQKSELDVKKWGAFTKWIHALRPTAMEQGMAVDDFLRSLTPDHFLVAKF